MTKKLIQSKYFPFLLFVFAFLLYTVNNGSSSIYILDEAKNTECAREMFEKGDWVVPTFNYNLRTDKPPLHYFFMMSSFKLFGVNEWAARFFSGVFGALTILITFLYTRRFASRKTALWSVFALLASVHLCIQFHLAVPDPYLIFFFTWSLFLFYAAVSDRRWTEIVLLYVAIGLGTLAKGPVSIALPGLIFLLFLIFSKQLKWPVIRSLKPFMGAIIVLTIALPWYILVGLETDWEWTRGFFLKHNLGRFAGEMEGHGGIFLITFAYILVGMFPFSTFLVQAYRNAIKDRRDHFVLFSLIAASVIILFFSFSGTKLPNYTVPSYPFLAILLGVYFSNLPELKNKIKSQLYQPPGCWYLFGSRADYRVAVRPVTEGYKIGGLVFSACFHRYCYWFLFLYSEEKPNRNTCNRKFDHFGKSAVFPFCFSAHRCTKPGAKKYFTCRR